MSVRDAHPATCGVWIWIGLSRGYNNLLARATGVQLRWVQCPSPALYVMGKMVQEARDDKVTCKCTPGAERCYGMKQDELGDRG